MTSPDPGTLRGELFQLRPRRLRADDERVEGDVLFEQRQRGQFGFLGHEFDLGLEAERLCEPGGGDALLLPGLAELDVILLRLHLRSERVAFESNARFDRPLHLRRVIL